MIWPLACASSRWTSRAGLAGIEQGIRFHQVNWAGHAPQGHVFVLGGGNTAMDCQTR